MKCIQFFFITIFLMSSFSCKDTLDRQVSFSLEQANDNCVELERVLKHYANEPEKLRAAKFLIANLPFRCSSVGSELDSVKSALRSVIPQKGIMDEALKKRWKRSNYKIKNVSDVSVVSSDLLIENIDLAFKLGEDGSGVNIIRLKVFVIMYCHIV